MLAWLVRLILIPAGVIAGWFVAKDAPNFGVVQMVVALVLMVFIVAVLAFSSRFDDRRPD
jgi:hypothetical protein